MRYDVIAVGGATEDLAFYVHDYVLINNQRDVLNQKLLAFDYGAKIPVNKTFISFGGGAANAAVTLASLGLKVALMSMVGDDGRGRRIIHNLEQRRVKTGLVQTKRRGISSISFIIIGAGNEHVSFSDRAVADDFKIKPHHLRALKHADWIYLSSLSGQWRDNLQKLFALPKAKIFWNPGSRQLAAGHTALKSFLRKTEVLSINKDEALHLLTSHSSHHKKPKAWLNEVKNLLKTINAWGPKIVLITEGARGISAYDGRKFYHQLAIKAKTKADTTGVGDAFASAFLAGLKMYHGDIERSLKLGAYNAAAKITEQGAQNGILDRIDAKRLKI